MNPLSKISDSDLEFQLKNLVAKERKLLHVILEHIREVDFRKIYLERAYSSLYEYLVKELGYSGLRLPPFLVPLYLLSQNGL
ncbi:MAG: hypothetical protein ACXVCR_11575 [Bdellovibrio sp.]